MIARELINHMIPPLKMTDNAKKAITWMEELRLNQLVVIDGGEYKGLINEEVILEDKSYDKQIADYDLIGKDCFVYHHQHFYDILKVGTDCGIHVIAVLDDDKKFIGSITIEDTIVAFAQTVAVQGPGGIIVLSMNFLDYSLTEISRHVESNNAKVLSSCLKNDPLEPSKVKLTLKINKEDVTHIIATLERFGYKVIARFQEARIESNEQERLGILMKYLEI